MELIGKGMKKYIYMAVAAIAALSSCSSDNDAILGEGGNGNNNGSAQVFTGIIESDATTRTTIADGTGTNKKVQWETGDEIRINGVTYTTTPNTTDATKATFAKKTTTDADPTATYKACYPATMASGTESSVTFSLPASYTYEVGKFNMPMYAQSEDTNLSFQNICGVLAIKVTSEEMSKVTKITVTSDKAISGPCTISAPGDKYAATATGTDNANKTVTLNCGEGVTPSAEGTTFYLPVPAISGAKLSIVVYGTATKATTDYKNLIYRQDMNTSNVSIARNTIYNVNFETSLAKFTVASGTTVNFTKSNLYWDGSAFKFEANQTDYPTAWDTNNVGHFYWSSSAAVAYAKTYSDASKSTSDKFFCGEDNKITVEGTSALFALSTDEWDYLINTRTNASSLRKYAVSVSNNGTNYANCLIIAPDSFTGTLQSSYTLADVNSLGLVCLPAAGRRSGSSFDNGGSYGRYWSSTPYSDGSGNANYLGFNSGNVYTNINIRKYGQSLRLVALPQ